MTTIIACVDFSSISEAVLRSAVSMSLATGAKLYLMHTYSYSPGVPEGEAVVYPRDLDLLELTRRDATTKLDLLVEKAQTQGVYAVPLLVEGPCVETVLDEARTRNADLLLIGSHGHGAMYDLLVGSTTRAILRKAECLVLIVPRQYRARIPEPTAAVDAHEVFAD